MAADAAADVAADVTLDAVADVTLDAVADVTLDAVADVTLDAVADVQAVAMQQLYQATHTQVVAMQVAHLLAETQCLLRFSQLWNLLHEQLLQFQLLLASQVSLMV